MRPACLALFLASVQLACAAEPARATLRAETVSGGRTRFHLVLPGGRRATITVARGPQVPARAPVEGASVVAVTPGAVVVTDRYRSRLGGGSGQCGAGEESFLRVLRLDPAGEAWQATLGSCWNDVELAHEDGLRWDAASADLQLRWLLGPSGTGREQARLRVLAGGDVQLLPPR